MLEKFINENIERNINSFEMTDDLYKRYSEFCKHHNYQIVNRRSFGIKIVSARVGGFYRKNKRPARWGVKLKPCKY